MCKITAVCRHPNLRSAQLCSQKFYHAKQQLCACALHSDLHASFVPALDRARVLFSSPYPRRTSTSVQSDMTVALSVSIFLRSYNSCYLQYILLCPYIELERHLPSGNAQHYFPGLVQGTTL